jgi:hypothetical protein
MKILVLVLAILLGIQSADASLTTSARKQAVTLVPASVYEINVDIDPDALKYSGHQKVTFTNRQEKSTNYLLFFIYPNDPALTKSKDPFLTVSNVKANGTAAKIEEKGPSLRVYLPQALQKGQSVTVEFDFQAEIPQQSGTKDLFSEAMDQLTSILNPTEKQPDYGIFSSNKDVLNLGLWYVALSKFDGEGWDEEAYAGIGDVSYFDPSSFNVRITAPAAYQVVTTGSSMKKVPGKEGRIEHHVEARMTRDFVVELSKQFEQKSAIRGQTSIRSFYLTKHRGSGEKVLDTAVKAFEYFYQEFGPYPYTELDVVEAPLYGGAGGVEFPGLVTVSSMLYKDDEADSNTSAFQALLSQSPQFDQLLEFVVAHEVAHQWWNAVVGSNSKKYPFIDEAMANYSAVLYFEHFYGREAAEKQMAMQMKLNYQMHRMLGGSDQPVLLPASAYNGPLEYSAIVYGKGALGFDKIRETMGDEAFFSAVKKYYKKFWFQTAGPYDFRDIAVSSNPANKEKVEAVFKHWMEEEHGDQDIGQGSLESLLATIMEGNSTSPVIDEQQLMKEVEKLLNEMNQTPP